MRSSSLRFLVIPLALFAIVDCRHRGAELSATPMQSPTRHAAVRASSATSALRAAYIAAVQRDAAEEHPIVRTASGFRATGAGQGLQADFDADGVAVSAERDGVRSRWRPTAVRFGCEGALSDVEAVAPTVEGNRATYRRSSFDEWYVVGPLGVEQGFTFRERPACRGAKRIELSGGGLEAKPMSNGGGATLNDGQGREVMRYADLHVVDAAGRALPAEVQVRGGKLSIAFDDATAMYPVVVDPLLQAAKLAPDDDAGETYFGQAVAVDGDTAVVVANTGGARAVAHVFVRTGDGWTEQGTLSASDASGRSFGRSVSVSGDTVVVGAPGFEEAGAAYVFERLNGTWSETPTMLRTGEDEEHTSYGSAVSVSGNRVIVGAPGDVRYGGAAYAFVRSETSWSPGKWLPAPTSVSSDEVGVAVSVSGNTAVVGAPGKSPSHGAAYVFVEAAGTWSKAATLTASDGAPGDRFGAAVSLSGDTVLVGAHLHASNQGAAYLFTRADATWTQLSPLRASGRKFGYAVSVSGDLAVVGTYDTSAVGAAYPFVRTTTGWSPQSSLTPNDGASGDRFGASVSVSRGTVIVGAHWHALDRGAAYVFAACANTGDCPTGFECAAGACVAGADAGGGAGGGADAGAGGGGGGGGGGGAGGGGERADASVDAAAPRDDGGGAGSGGSAKRCRAPSDCPSGYCVDGLCCDSACTDACHSCALPTSPGVCSVEPLGTDLRFDCGPRETCLGTCNGAGECIAARGGAQCAASRCTGRSTGAGPTLCVATEASCLVDEAVPFDCGAYACFAPTGRCISECHSVDDCADGFVCDERQRCAPAASPAAEEGGCGCRTAGAPSGGAAGLAMLAAAAAWGLARQRRRAGATARASDGRRAERSPGEAKT